MKPFPAVIMAVLAMALLSCRASQVTDPSSDPVVTATPEPTVATPPPTPPSALSCQLPAMPDNGNCSRTAPAFHADVERVIDEIIDQHPEVFDMNDVRGCGRQYRCPYVANGPRFEQLMMQKLEALGYCAKCDEECGVKDSNHFNEQYDLMIAEGYLRRGEGAYRATCYPAAF
jgi:hypothetical protein